MSYNSQEKTKRFVKVPHTVLHANLSNTSFRLWCEIASHKEGFNLKISDLMIATSIKHKITMKKCLNELEDRNLLSVIRTKGKVNQYCVLSEPSEKKTTRQKQGTKSEPE